MTVAPPLGRLRLVLDAAREYCRAAEAPLTFTAQGR
jgi:hypothetical protein